MSEIIRVQARGDIHAGDVITIGNEPIGVAISTPDLDGATNVLVHGSTFSEGVSLGGYSQLHDCYINGTVELSGDNCVITGCVIQGSNDYGINITANNQRSTQINHDDWPTNAIGDINQGRAELQNQGYINVAFTLIGPQSVIDLLDATIPNTDVTYRQFLLQNGLLGEVRVDDTQSEVILTAPHGAWTGQKTKFTDEVAEKAWKLLEEYMTQTQYFAFMEGTKIELENKLGDFRLLIDKKGDFNILEGKRGEGIVAANGRIKSYDYPLGDEIAAFLDWFNHKTKELISQWNCGTYGIVKEGQRR